MSVCLIRQRPSPDSTPSHNLRTSHTVSTPKPRQLIATNTRVIANKGNAGLGVSLIRKVGFLDLTCLILHCLRDLLHLFVLSA